MNQPEPTPADTNPVPESTETPEGGNGATGVPVIRIRIAADIQAALDALTELDTRQARANETGPTGVTGHPSAPNNPLPAHHAPDTEHP